MMTVKIGDLNWMDAPYNPHLSKNLSKIQLPDRGNGLALTVMLIDSSTGTIKHIRLLGLSEYFTRNLLGTVMEQMTDDFNERAYNNSIHRIYSVYTTKAIVKNSKDYCKL